MCLVRQIKAELQLKRPIPVHGHDTPEFVPGGEELFRLGIYIEQDLPCSSASMEAYIAGSYGLRVHYLHRCRGCRRCFVRKSMMEIGNLSIKRTERPRQAVSTRFHQIWSLKNLLNT